LPKHRPGLTIRGFC